MKPLIALSLFAAVLAGCKSTDDRPGGPETSTVEGDEDVKLTIVQPADQLLPRGETNRVAVSIIRKNFEEPVAVRFDDLPAGVKVLDSNERIERDQSIRTYTLHAEPEADEVHNHVVHVTVVGPDGLEVTESFRLTVK